MKGVLPVIVGNYLLFYPLPKLVEHVLRSKKTWSEANILWSGVELVDM
jgi:hypothetical protein